MIASLRPTSYVLRKGSKPGENFETLTRLHFSIVQLSPSIGRHLDPAALLLYADHLYGRRPPAWRLTIVYQRGNTPNQP